MNNNSRYSFIVHNDKKIYFGKVGQRLQEYKIVEDDDLGSIYIGRVERVLTDKKMCFVNLGQKKGFLNLTNHDLKEGDCVLCQISRTYALKETQKKDRLSCTLQIYHSNYGIRFNKSGVVHFLHESKMISKKQVPTEILETLVQQMKHILVQSQFLPVPRCLYRPLLFDYPFGLSPDENILCNDKMIFSYLKERSFDNVKLKEEYLPFYDENISHDIRSLDWHIVPLKGGGEIVIDKTEACWVIDVNTKSDQREDAAFLTNKEAIEEILFQINLRPMTGIIIVDSVRMDEEKELQIDAYIQRQLNNPYLSYHGRTRLGLREFTRSQYV